MKNLLAVLAATLTMAGGVQAESPSRFPDDLEKLLVQDMKKANDLAPMMIDSGTRFNGITREAWNKFTYHFTMTSFDAAALREIDFDKRSREFAIPRQCASKSVLAFLELGGINSFSFTSKDGIHLNTIVVDKQTCAGQAG